MEPVSDEKIYSNRYQVTHLIARGGMAMVYRAHDLLLNRFVALKLLYPELSVDRNFVERFRREAQAAANLSHPNIVPVFDWGEEQGTYFIVMELVEGTSLAELLAESRTLSAQKSAQVVAQVASALSYAHRQGVVHRDVKPGNILLTNDGQVKVTDFGIAQAISTEDNLTTVGSVMGTATYFSPEQAEGAVVDGRSDVYSLGIVLYELLAGRPPFLGDSPVAVATKHVRETTPSPKLFNPAVPADLEVIVLHALAKRPEDRYQTADEFRADLLRFSEGQPVSVSGQAAMGDDVTRAVAVVTGERTQSVPIMSGPRTDIRRRRRIWPVVVIIVAFLVIVGGGAGAYLALRSPGVTQMPDVVNLGSGAAQRTLADVGLVVETVHYVRSSDSIGTVVRTQPRAGKRVHKGQGVTLYISRGEVTHTVQVPSVVGTTVATAEAALGAVSLDYTVTFTSQSTSQGQLPGDVISQSPVGGVNAQTGTKVVLVVLSSSSTYAVPNVAGDSPTAAAAQLGAAGLTVSTTQGSECSNKWTSGTVAQTDPAIGQPVKSGTSIELIVSTGACPVIVPTVTGDTENEAVSALTSAGLTDTVTYLTTEQCTASGGESTTTTTVYSDYVLNQSVAGGSTVPYGTQVVLDYCPPSS